MTTNLMTGTPARDASVNTVQQISGRVTAVSGAGATQSARIGTLPAGALILGINSNVETALVGTSPLLHLGTTATGQDIATGIAATAGTAVTPPLAALVNPVAADTAVWASISGTPTAGDAYVSVQFIKPAT
jgi:hypothetical protein